MSDPVNITTPRVIIPTPIPVSVNTPVIVTPKPYWASKTMIYNWAKGALAFVTAMAVGVEMLLHSGGIPFPVNESYLIFGIAILLMVDSYFGVQLRKVTVSPIEGVIAAPGIVGAAPIVAPPTVTE